MEKHSIEIGTKYSILPNINLMQFPSEALQALLTEKRKHFKVHRKFKSLKIEKVSCFVSEGGLAMLCSIWDLASLTRD